MADPLFPGLPLNGGQLQTIPGGATVSQIITVLNNVINQLNDQLETQIYSDTSSKRMLIGYQKGGWDSGASDFGIKISLPGVDVTTAADTDLLFSMGLSTWNWRNSSGALFKEMDVANGQETYYSNNGTLVKKYDADKGNETFYDPSTTKDIGQQGILPDGTGGAAWAKPGDSVDNAYGV